MHIIFVGRRTGGVNSSAVCLHSHERNQQKNVNRKLFCYSPSKYLFAHYLNFACVRKRLKIFQHMQWKSRCRRTSWTRMFLLQNTNLFHHGLTAQDVHEAWWCSEGVMPLLDTKMNDKFSWVEPSCCSNKKSGNLTSIWEKGF